MVCPTDLGYLKVLRKTPENKMLAFIPVLRELVMFKLVWKSKYAGIIWFVCAIGGLALFLAAANTGIQIIGWLGLAMIMLQSQFTSRDLENKQKHSTSVVVLQHY